MKKLFTFTALLLIAATLIGQAPAGFKYQAVLRDSRGNVKANVTANIKIDILQGSSSGSIVYSENHSVTTNMYGLINLEVGNGVATKSSFSAIDWGTSTYFIKIFVDGVEMGTDQLLSVPYALNAKTAEKVTGKIAELDPLFLASPANGITSNNLTNWNSAFDWGNHATAGYLKASSPNDVSNWNTAFGWGNHATAGYLKSYTETDPAFLASPAKGITTNNITDWNKAVAWGDHALAGYLKSSSENDPIFKAWDKSTGISITAAQVSDFESSVTNNLAVLGNTAKISYPVADKLKLAGIQDSAEANVNADWNATSGDAKILNKPTIPVGTNVGDMQYWNGTAWVMVPVGQPGQFLKLNSSNIPEWAGMLPTVITTAVSSITDVSSVSGGTVTSDGGGTITARGICFSTSQSPTTSNNTINSGAGTGSFVSNISGLSYATTYYLKAFATNSAGTSYGSEVNFKTNSVLPTVTTTAISSITQTTASSGGNITNDGGASISAWGGMLVNFCQPNYS